MWTEHWLLYLVRGAVKYFAKLCGRSRTKPHTSLPDPGPPSPRRLPLEIVERCMDFVFETRPPVANANQTRICDAKPSWEAVAGLMAASLELHRMGLARWLAVFIVRHPHDWDKAIHYSHIIRQVQCLDGALSVRNRRVLAEFPRLHTLSIDVHDDIVQDRHNRFAYRDLFLSLPSSLRRLEILRAHGPDINIINIVKSCAPNLEELRLGRCTVFNGSSICRFWQAFPTEHDSYMSIEDTDSYANSIAKELAPLQSLKILALGLYLIPSNTILAHRLYHRRGITAPETIEWQQAIPLAEEAALAEIPPAPTNQLVSLLHQTDSPEEFGPDSVCRLCIDSVSQIGYDAEMRACIILKSQLPNIVSVQWMSWLSPDHLGINEHLP